MNNLELVFLEFKHIYKTQRTSLFSFYLFIFYLLFFNHSVYILTLSTFSYLSAASKHTGWACSLFLLLFCNLCALQLLCLDRFIKMNPSSMQIFLMRLKLRLDLTLLKLVCLNCQKSNIRTNSPCYSVLLWASFCFLQFNHQKCAGMVSTNNITYSEQI